MKKLLFLLIILLFCQNFSYAKLIEFENCYRTDHVLKENSVDKEDIKNIKWREDFYNLKNTNLYLEFDKKKIR